MCIFRGDGIRFSNNPERGTPTRVDEWTCLLTGTYWHEPKPSTPHVIELIVQESCDRLMFLPGGARFLKKTAWFSGPPGGVNRRTEPPRSLFGPAPKLMGLALYRAAVVPEAGPEPARAFFADLGVYSFGKRNVEMRGEHEAVPHLAGSPAEHVALLVDFHVREADTAKFRRHVFRAFTLVEGGSGNFGDGDLGIERLPCFDSITARAFFLSRCTF